ncbi:MAG TPA: hypothetical protein VHQ01_11505 [Pyrinomonadaceae bacterium]|nr:hypothetical protein [Pyrinomonadaceae bacterium]
MLLIFPIFCYAQQERDTSAIRSSPAYAEVLLRKTELQSDVEAFSADYTESNPKLLDTRFELGLIDREMERLFAVKPSESSKLTLALGKLMVRKAAIATDLNRLTRSYNKDHPEVKRAAKKLDIFEVAVKDILR